MPAATLQRIRDSEREIQRVFDAWPFGVGAFRKLHTDSREYVVVGCPKWLTARRRSALARTLAGASGYDLRPDLVWEGDDQTFVLELKSAFKYEPLALPEVLHHARVIERLARDDGAPRRVLPVIVTQYNVWLREALAFLFARGLERHAVRYLEFDALHLLPRALGEPDRGILWLDEPFAPWTPAEPPRALVELVRELGPALQHKPRYWHWVDATSTWVTTEREQPLSGRPLFIEGPYGMIAATGPDTFVLWSGSQVDGGVYHLGSVEGPANAPRLASPRLANADDAEAFRMVIADEATDRA